MWRRILLVLAATLAAPASAHACTALPAGFAEDARVTGSSRAGLPTDLTRTSLCVRAAGRRIVLRRARLTQPSRGRRVVVVYVVRIGARGIVRPERRIVVRRDRSRLVPEVDVAITARGELAWLAPVRRPADWNAVVYDPPDGTPRRVGLDFAGRLAVEDRITLRWYSGEHLGFFELPRRPGGGCPARTRFRHVASNDTIRVTRRTHNETVLVVRACLLATGGDRAVAQALPGFDELLGVVGLDRHWIVVWRGHILRTGESCEITQSVIDARSGGIRRQARTYPCEGGLPLPTEGAPLAVTSRGVAAWVSDQDGVRRLLAAGPDERVVELDRGAIEGLRARGAAVEWTRDGAPRSMELP